MSVLSAMQRMVAVVPGESGRYAESSGLAFVTISVAQAKSGAVAPYPGGPTTGSGGGESGTGCASGIGERGA